MSRKKYKLKTSPPSFRPSRRGVVRVLWLVPLLLIVGALLDPALIAPFPPLAAPPQDVSAQFTRCGPGRAPACVVDGDTFKLGDTKIRITGIDAPELVHPLCPAEAALARRAADRLQVLLNQGQFEMIAHRLHRTDAFGRELMVIRRGDVSIGDQLIDEGLAHRYLGSKRSWCW